MLSERLDKGLQQIMQQLLQRFAQLHRLSGSKDAERSVDLLCETLAAHYIPFERLSCPLWLSDPLAGSLTIAGWEIAAKTRSFSAACPDGIEADLYYDARSLDFVPEADMATWRTAVRGKIVIADQGFEDYVQRLAQAGAAGLVHIWGSAEQALHEETVGPIWGTPVPDDVIRYPQLPVISINQQDGQALLARIKQQTVTARMMTELHEHVAHCSLPVVEIKGESDHFVLLSSHYDSWHTGLTDNATGNALCLAMAIHFAAKGGLKRSLRIAWWPGHSNARYGGSTWYADNRRHQLSQLCDAHINVDSPGCQNATEVVVNCSGAEDIPFLNQGVLAVTGAGIRRISPLGKGGDQSFWGMNIPLHFAFREEPALRSSHSPGSGGGWWWHTEEDWLDKVDEEILWRDTLIHGEWLSRLLYETALPVNLLNYHRVLCEDLQQLRLELDPAFDLTEVENALLSLRESLVLIHKSDHARCVVICALWHRLRYSSTDEFHYDLSYHGGAFPGLQRLCGHRRITTSDRYWLMLETQFRRQRDRILALIMAVTRPAPV